MMGLMDFFTPEAGQKRRNWLESQLGGMWEYVPPELRPFVALGNELNPMTSMERAGTSAQAVANPNVRGWDKVQAVGDTASNMAAFVAPIAASSKGAVPAVQAVEDALMGFSTSAPGVAAKDFMADEFGGVGFRAFHGSPHDFDRFSLDKIGTGEGAQGQGHGLYFAGREDAAKWYANEYGGGNGRMYEVKIDANPRDFLDWNRAVADMPASVKDAVKSAYGGFVPPDTAGMKAYTMLKERLGSAEAASQAMRDAGIPGVKYEAGKGSRNYVVFDDKLIEILRKYGLVPGMIGAGAYGMAPQDAQAGQ